MSLELEVAWTRKYNFNFMASFAWMLKFQAAKFLDFSFKHAINQGIGSQTICWVEKKERKKFDEIITSLFLEDWQKFNDYLKLYDKYKNNLLKIAKEINSADLKIFNKKELAKLYQKFEEANLEFMLMGQWVPFRSSEMIPYIVEEKLKNDFDSQDINKILAVILTPFSQSAIMKCEEETLYLAEEVKNKKISRAEYEEKINTLVEKYIWMPSMIMDTPEWDYEHFDNEIKK